MKSTATCLRCNYRTFLRWFLVAYVDEDLDNCPKCGQQMLIAPHYHPSAPTFASVYCPTGCYECLSLTAWLEDSEAEAASYDKYREEEHANTEKRSTQTNSRAEFFV